MHSDSWVGVSYEDCPPHIQHNIQVIRRMDAFHAANEANEAALERYVEGLYQGQSLDKPRPVAVPSVDDEEMEFMMVDDIRGAEEIADLMLADDAQAIKYFLSHWRKDLQRKWVYLAYNRKALEKRYRNCADQKEIDRVKKLISDGEKEISFLQPRIEWARQKIT